MPQGALSLEAADAYCRGLVRHYENFTVASRLSPRSLRRDLTRVYAFCRYTDDLGDESGDRAVAMRRLRRWRDETRESFEHDERTHPVLLALTDTVHRSRTRSTPLHRPHRRQHPGPAHRHIRELARPPSVLHALSRTSRPNRPTPVRHNRPGCHPTQRRRLHRPPTRQLRTGRLRRQETRPHISIANRHPQPRNRPGNSLDVRTSPRTPRVRRRTRSDGTAPPSRATSPVQTRRDRHPRRNSRSGIPHGNAPPKGRPRNARANRRQGTSSNESDERWAQHHGAH